MDTSATPTTTTGTVARQRATVTIPAIRRGPVCARRGCHWTAWFIVHHVPVCSSACAEALAREVPRRRAEPQVYLPVVRAVGWTSREGGAWTLVLTSCGRRHDYLRAWWWAGIGLHAGHRGQVSRGSVDILTDAGFFRVVRHLVRTGASDLRALRLAAEPWERGTVPTPPWTDVALPQEPTSLARAIVRAAKTKTRQRERVRALRARHRQRGVSHDGTTHASRVA